MSLSIVKAFINSHSSWLNIYCWWSTPSLIWWALHSRIRFWTILRNCFFWESTTYQSRKLTDPNDFRWNLCEGNFPIDRRSGIELIFEITQVSFSPEENQGNHSFQGMHWKNWHQLIRFQVRYFIPYILYKLSIFYNHYLYIFDIFVIKIFQFRSILSL